MEASWHGQVLARESDSKHIQPGIPNGSGRISTDAKWHGVSAGTTTSDTMRLLPRLIRTAFRRLSISQLHATSVAYFFASCCRQHREHYNLDRKSTRLNSSH